MPRMTDEAIHCEDITVNDAYGNPVEMSVFHDKGSNGLFAVDSSFLDQEEPEVIPSPFNAEIDLILVWQ
jgi:hypothetical protein